MSRYKNIESSPKPKALTLGLFLCLLFILKSNGALPIGPDESWLKKLPEEMSETEKSNEVRRLLSEGNRFQAVKQYDRAYEAYERVFVLSPKNEEASKRLDDLRKQMTRDGKDQSGLVAGIYDSEIEMRAEQYWKEVHEYVEKGQTARAAFTLEKILLLKPLDQGAAELYEELQSKLAGEES